MSRPTKPATPFDGVAWVTGASKGLGHAVALALVNQGWRVVVTARNEDQLLALQKKADHAYGKIIIMAGDVCDSARMQAIVDTIERDHGGVGLAVLNAGLYQPIEGDKLDCQTFQTSLDVNLMGVVHCLVPLSHAMHQRRRGQIALVASVAGYGGLPTSAAYGATKAGLINLAESLKFDFDKMGICLQIANPGFIDTPATQRNPFHMPFLMNVDQAAQALLAGLSRGSFEITFPKIFTRLIKLLGFLPYPLYFAVLSRLTKWKERPLATEKEMVLPENKPAYKDW